jgi:hypothetical protein
VIRLSFACVAQARGSMALSIDWAGGAHPMAQQRAGGGDGSQRSGPAAAVAVSHSCACTESPCLRHCVHGAPIGGGGGGGGLP